jgi:hypothetical protein
MIQSPRIDVRPLLTVVLLTKAESAFGPCGATMTRKPEFLTELLGAEVERHAAVTDECNGHPKKIG